MPIEFRSSSYQAQVCRLRLLALEAVKLFPVRNPELEFINHGENTTFKVTDGKGQRSLLRVHRADYHTEDAIQEELSWLAHLRSTKVHAPVPLQSRKGRLLELVSRPDIDAPRPVDLLKWVDGRFVFKNVRPHHMLRIGQLLGDLQLDTRDRKVKHRRYWTPEGLIGENAKLGSVYALRTATKREQSRVTGAARELLAEFKRYEKSVPKKMGLVHADLHFGNMVFNESGQPSPIDFDDCGFGFHMYDLAVVMTNIDYLVQELKKTISFDEFRDALFEGYRSRKEMDSRDEEMVRLLLIARRLMMVGWLEQRSDNPRLAKRTRGSLDRALAAIKTL